MNIFTDIVFIFVFIFTLLQFGIINIKTTNIIIQKFYIFIAVTMFCWLLYSMKSIRRQNSIKIWDMISNGLIIGMLAYVGHTLFFDMYYMPETHILLSNNIDSIFFTHEIMLCIFISISIMIGKSVGYIFYTEACN
jgi:hypothetical protein